ncbi:hypothetical protein [Aliiglaciecola litoralis]|uniref:Molecular chaperone n=1 Tax=Aliiglaciecola litoralis TaxID=582857 RepID=A0ABN1LFA8_9ALTE
MFKILLSIVFFSTLSLPVSANLSLSKFRLYFDNSNRNDALQLRNKGDRAISYAVELGLVSMTEEGTLHVVEEDPYSAIGLLRYSPKRGTIEPGERQALRFSVRKPAGLKDGEYRAVLKVTSAPLMEQSTKVAMQSKLAYSLPIIIRHGRLSASTKLTEAKLVTVGDTASIEVWQLLEGNRSVFGNFIVEDDNGNEVGVLNSSAVYQPLTRRRVIIPLSQNVSGKITVKFSEVALYGGTEKAQTTVIIN